MNSIRALLLVSGFFLVAASGCGGCGAPIDIGADCRKDADCRGGLVCVAGTCARADGGNAGGGAGGGSEQDSGNDENRDSDCDGVTDKAEGNGSLGCNLNPASADSDGDGIPDGVELGVVAPGPDATCSYDASSFDADPTTTTSPCNPDSDGDGITDGAEDANQNGKVDTDELDPKDANDGQGPTGEACSTNKLRQVSIRQHSAPDLQVAVGTGFDPANGGQLSVISVGGVERGLMGYHPATKVAFIAFTEAARNGATAPLQDEAAMRAPLANAGALSNVTTQTFVTWDGHFAAQAFYDQAGTVDVIAQANSIASSILGAGAGVLNGSAGAVGPFKLQVEYVHRSASAVAVVIAIIPLNLFKEPAIFVAADTAGGSALAAFPDTTGIQCEPFQTKLGKVDILFSVDDSASMPDEQQALANVATLLAQQLNNTTLDWRIAMVTTSYLAAPLIDSNRSVRRGFTRDINQFKAWLTQNSACATNGTCTLVTPAPACNSNGADAGYAGRGGGCWIGAGGVGNVAAEAILGAARKAIDDLSPGTTGAERIDQVRADAQVVVVLLGDADDQTTGYTTSNAQCAANNNCEAVDNFIKFFNGTGTTLKVDKNALGKKIIVHGIACPDGATCSETQATPRRHFQVIAGTGGVGGNIYDQTSIQSAMNGIIQSIIAAGGHRLTRPPIGASIKVALGAVQTPASCDKNDLPRSRVNGFDFDGVTKAISLYGACRPPAVGTPGAVSYRYWIKKAAGGCVPFNCGGSCSAGLVCNVATCVCEPDIN